MRYVVVSERLMYEVKVFEVKFYFICSIRMASKKSKAVATDAGATVQDSQGRFTAEEDEQIIDLVRSNECLYNVAHKQYKNNNNGNIAGNIALNMSQHKCE